LTFKRGSNDRLGDFAHVLRACLEDISDAHRWSEPEITDSLTTLGSAAEDIQRCLLRLAVESRRRGLHADSGLSLRDWLAQECPLLSKRALGDIVTPTRAWDADGHQTLRDHLTPAPYMHTDLHTVSDDPEEEPPPILGVSRGAQVARALARVRSATTPEEYEVYVGILVPYAVTASDKDLCTATDLLISLALTDAQVEGAAQRAFASRGVHESSISGDELRRFIITTDQEGAAVIRAILNSPLAAPAPDAEGADLRTATQRRHDALLAVLRRGVSSPGEAPTTSKAKVFLTMPLAALMAAARAAASSAATSSTTASPSFDPDAPFAGQTGRRTSEAQLSQLGGPGMFARPGMGRTFTREALTPGQVRRMVCEADLIPVVLGTDSEVLDVGRESRLATPGQLKKLWLRDEECTFPGCSIPNTWCDAHQVTWWSRAGNTDIDNLALLCGRHHTIVHERDLSATFDPDDRGQRGHSSPRWQL